MKTCKLFLITFALCVFIISADRVKREPDKTTSIFGEDNDNSVSQGQGQGSEILNDVNNLKKKNENENAHGFLPLPPGYNKLIIPLANVTSSLFIMVHLSIRQILDVDTDNGIVEMDTELGITWIDWEIWKYFIEDKEAQQKAKYGPEEIILDAEFLKQIWKPDIFIEEMASVERTFLLSKLITLRFLVRNEIMPGAITYRSRQSFKVRCDMEFSYYPADTQKCPLNIRSYSYPEAQLFLVWNPNQKIFLDQVEDSNYDMQVSNVEPGEELYDLYTTFQAPCCSHQNFSTLTFTLQLRRNIKYHLIQTCLPSILLVLITWLCFLLPTDMIEARIGVSMTTLLTLTAMFSSVRDQSPQVSYTMAIDVWMVFCILVLFIALVLFTVTYWMRRRLEKSEGDQNGLIGARHTQKSKAGKLYQAIAKDSKKCIFILFALIFFIFLVLFAAWLCLASGYMDWSPSPNYNAIPVVDADGKTNDTLHLFTKQEKKFRANSTKKVIESQFRFKDIFKQVIFPKIQELEAAEAEPEEEPSSDPTEATTIQMESSEPTTKSTKSNRSLSRPTSFTSFTSTTIKPKSAG